MSMCKVCRAWISNYIPQYSLECIIYPCCWYIFVHVPACCLLVLNTLRPRQNGRHFPDDMFKWIFLNENLWISIKISLEFVLQGPINNIPTLVQIIAWRRSGDKPLSEPMMVSLLTHICLTRPQWVNSLAPGRCAHDFKSIISEYLLVIKFMSIYCEIVLRWMPQNAFDYIWVW